MNTYLRSTCTFDMPHTQIARFVEFMADIGMKDGGYNYAHKGSDGGYTSTIFQVHPFYGGPCTCGNMLHRIRIAKKEHERKCFQYSYSHLRSDPNVFGATGPNGQRIREDAVKSICSAHKVPYLGVRESSVHCTCGLKDTIEAVNEEFACTEECKREIPNFLYRPVGIALSWVKDPANGLKSSQEISDAQFDGILTHCLKSFKGDAETVPDMKRFSQPSLLDIVDQITQDKNRCLELDVAYPETQEQFEFLLLHLDRIMTALTEKSVKDGSTNQHHSEKS